MSTIQITCKSLDLLRTRVIKPHDRKFSTTTASPIVSHNKLSTLPWPTFDMLKQLRTCRLSHNELQLLLDGNQQCHQLVELDVRMNPHLTQLPASLVKLKQLQSLHVDCGYGRVQMRHPPSEVCQQGAAAIIAHLSKIIVR